MIDEHAFIALSYTGRMEQTGRVFDTTDPVLAGQEHIHMPHAGKGSVTVPLGRGILLAGLEAHIKQAELDKEYTVTLSPQDAFGKKDAKLLRLVPQKLFLKQGLKIYPGMQVRIDNQVAVIKTVNGGRCIVDFNHPLAGHDVTYTYRVLSLVDDEAQKTQAVFDLFFGVPVKARKEAGKVHVTLPDTVSSEIINAVREKVKEVAGVDLIISQEKEGVATKKEESTMSASAPVLGRAQEEGLKQEDEEPNPENAEEPEQEGEKSGQEKAEEPKQPKQEFEEQRGKTHEKNTTQDPKQPSSGSLFRNP